MDSYSARGTRKIGSRTCLESAHCMHRSTTLHANDEPFLWITDSCVSTVENSLTSNPQLPHFSPLDYNLLGINSSTPNDSRMLDIMKLRTYPGFFCDLLSARQGRCYARNVPITNQQIYGFLHRTLHLNCNPALKNGDIDRK